MKIHDENLVTLSLSLTGDHLGLALEAFYRLDEMDKRSKNALSSILHAYCALESAVNSIGFEIFFNKDSHKYLDEKKRDIPLKKLLKAWKNSLPCLEKIDYLLSIHSEKIEDNLRYQLDELNNLRNLISHGFDYTVTWLIEPNENNKTSGTILDYEYSVDWKKKFPKTKFNPLDKLNKVDAEKALRIVINILIKLATVMEQPISLTIYNETTSYKVIYKDTVVDDFIKK